jgi:selenide,water dikinase
VAGSTIFDEGVPLLDRLLLADAQTSGGLLVAVRPEMGPALLEALRKEGTLAAAHIGLVVDGAAGTITVHAGSEVER